MKRFLSLVLALAVVLCCQSAFAAVAFEKSVIYDSITALFEENFTDYEPEFEYDAESSVFIVSLASPDGSAMALMLENEDSLSSWESMTENMNSIGKSVIELFETSGYESVHFGLMLRSDANEENILFSSLDGYTLYNVTDDLSD